jgi:hypothetical protein
LTKQISAAGTGGAPFRYPWRLNGENIPGATNSIYTITNAQPRDGGMHSVLIANKVRVISSREAEVRVGTKAIRMSRSAKNSIFPGAASRALSRCRMLARKECSTQLVTGEFHSASR